LTEAFIEHMSRAGRRLSVIVASTAVHVMLVASIAHAAPGDLDLTFGTGGTVLSENPEPGYDYDLALALIRQPDGKLVAAGRSRSNFALARFTSNGVLDTTFGSGGWVTTDFAGGSDEIRALGIQPDGKLVAAGYAGVGNFNDFALARYNANGTLDPTFGTGGKVTTHFGAGSSTASAMVIRPNGKLLVGGSSGSANPRFTVVRFNPNGSLDASYGTGGAAITDFAPGGEHIHALVHVGSGKVVAAGYASSVGGSDFALVRYSAGGVLDTTFGVAGKTITDFAVSSDYAQALALRTDGKLVAGGVSNGNFALGRYTSAGLLDTTFGTAGKVTTDFGESDEVNALVLQGGKILAAGSTGVSIPEVYTAVEWALARYYAGGTLDATFGTGGKVVTNVGTTDGFGSANAILLADGKAVAAGAAPTPFTPSSSSSDFGLARFLL
jgi:uncharacterized delta-60 repeat protein